MVIFFALSLARFKMIWFGVAVLGFLVGFGLVLFVCLFGGVFFQKNAENLLMLGISVLSISLSSVFIYTETPDLHTEAWPLPSITKGL